METPKQVRIPPNHRVVIATKSARIIQKVNYRLTFCDDSRIKCNNSNILILPLNCTALAAIKVAKIFHWGGQTANHRACNDVIRNFQLDGLFMIQRYPRRMEYRKPGPGLASNQDFAEGGRT